MESAPITPHSSPPTDRDDVVRIRVRPPAGSRAGDLARLLGVDADIVAAALVKALEGSPELRAAA